MSMLLVASRLYQRSFDTRPYTTLAFTNGTLFALGDAVAQCSQIFRGDSSLNKSPAFDPTRTLRFFTFGLAMGPFLGRWNKFLETQFPLRNLAGGAQKLSRGAPAALKRVAADQLLMAPIGLFVFLGYMGIMEGLDQEHIGRKFQDLYAPALSANWKVWPLAQFVNFRFVPLPYRIPFQATLGIFWNLYLSLLNSSSVQVQQRHDAMHTMLEH